jgi:hypothetical protein
MDHETLNSLDKEMLICLILSQAEAIERSMKEVEAFRASNAKLHADIAGLRAKLNLPPKACPRACPRGTPDNSSTPPSRGNKVSGDDGKASEGKRRKPHAGSSPISAKIRLVIG